MSGDRADATGLPDWSGVVQIGGPDQKAFGMRISPVGMEPSPAEWAARRTAADLSHSPFARSRATGKFGRYGTIFVQERGWALLDGEVIWRRDYDKGTTIVGRRALRLVLYALGVAQPPPFLDEGRVPSEIELKTEAALRRGL